MLPRIARSNPSASGRVRWSLLLCSLVILTLPTWTQQARSQVGVTDKAEKQDPKTRLSTNRQATSPLAGVRRSDLPVAPPSIEVFPELAGAEKKILATLNEEVQFDFVEESLEGVIACLTDKHGLQIVIDTVKLEAASISVDSEIFTLKISGISLRAALKLLLKPHNLTFVIEDEVLKVISLADAENQKPITRFYPARDLLGKSDVDDQLMLKTIQLATNDLDAGVTWIEFDGAGGDISILPAIGCLVIRATRETHEEVLKVMRTIRQANQESAVQ